MAAIGIDLGTTNSCVAVLGNNQVDILQNHHSNRVTPSCVAYNENEQMVGDDAKEQRGDNPENTIFSVKRLIGLEFDDAAVQNDLKLFPFKVFKDSCGGPKIRLETNVREAEMFPEQISGIVLSEMKKIAEERIGGKVYNAVITVPAYFNNAQRSATIAAANIADLNVMKIIAEPDAAAIAYTQQQKISKQRTVLVYDLGGGTFDVTLLTICGANVEMLATGGDTHLGGDDFNMRMFDNLAQEVKKKHGINMLMDASAKAKLLEKCENLKISLTKKTMHSIKVKSGGKSFNFQISRAKFEHLNEDLFKNTLETVKKVLDDAGLTPAGIDEVLLVGGSTRIPYIRNMLEKHFGAAKILQKVNPDEAVAYGAAVYAAHLSGVEIPGIGEVRVRSVYPLNLGTDIVGGLMDVLIRRNTPFPVKKTKIYGNARDNQTGMSVQVYEGIRAKYEDNTRLGGFQISPIQPKPEGEANVEVTFELDENGILDVTACDKSTGHSQSITVKTDQKKFSEHEIAEMMQDAERCRAVDNEFRRKTNARNALEGLVYDVRKRSISNLVLQKCEEIEDWIENNTDASRDDFVAKQNELEAFEKCND